MYTWMVGRLVRRTFNRMSEGDWSAALRLFDVVVKGPPWSTRVGTRFTGRTTCSDGTTFVNHGMQYVRLAWGKVTYDQLYEDTQTIAEAVAHQRALEGAPA